MTGGANRTVIRLALAAIALRGVGYALLTPTYEGWDEYQHVAYFETLKVEEIPRLNRSEVPPRVMLDVGTGPVPAALTIQAPSAWLQSYREYWKNPAEGADSRVPLYEAQHGPWYYLFHCPLMEITANIGGLFWSVRFLRLANLTWTLFAVWCVAYAMRRRRINRRVTESTLVLLAVQSLFLMTTVRVANDAMAMALAFAALALLSRSQPDESIMSSGLLLGVAGAVKATAWTLFPAFLALLLMNRISKRRFAGFIIVFSAAAVGALALDCLRNGRFAPTQEAYVLAERGEGINAVVRAATQINWFDEFSRRWGRQLLWVGGWSFAPLPKFLPRLHQWILAASIIPLILRLSRGGPRHRGFAAFCLLACLGIAAGQAIHMAQSKAALGFVATPAWYAVIALPWLFAGLAWSWRLNERLWRIATTLFFGLLLSSEIVGVFFVWLPTFADSHDPAITIQRCSILAGGKALFALGVVGFVLGWAAACLALKSALRRETA